MMQRIWDPYITGQDRDNYQMAGFGQTLTLGRTPALLIVDVTYGFTGEEHQSRWESLEMFPTSCGPESWTAVHAIRQLVDKMRGYGFPVIYTVSEWSANPVDAGAWLRKGTFAGHPQMLCGARGTQVVDVLQPADEEMVISKRKPSAFFGTSLLSYLVHYKADSLIVTGCTTSGCVRATVVDGFSLNYPIVVPEDCVFDRSLVSHAINLFDMHQKYADVVPLEEVMKSLDVNKTPTTA